VPDAALVIPERILPVCKQASTKAPLWGSCKWVSGYDQGPIYDPTTIPE